MDQLFLLQDDHNDYNLIWELIKVKLEYKLEEMAVTNQDLRAFATKIEIELNDDNDIKTCLICNQMKEMEYLTWFIYGLPQNLKLQLLNSSISISNINGALKNLFDDDDDKKKNEEIKSHNNETIIWKLIKDIILSTNQNKDEPPTEFADRIKLTLSNCYSQLQKLFNDSSNCSQCLKRLQIEFLSLFINGLESKVKSSLIDKITFMGTPSSSVLKNIVSVANSLWTSSCSSSSSSNDYSVTNMDWIKRKRKLIMFPDETPKNFSIRVENLVLSAHHDLIKSDKEKINCQTCDKKNQIECLTLFLNGILPDFQLELEDRLVNCHSQTMLEALSLADNILNKSSNNDPELPISDEEHEEEIEHDESEEEEEENEDQVDKEYQVPLKKLKKKTNEEEEEEFDPELTNEVFEDGFRYVRMGKTQIAQIKECDYRIIWDDLKQKYPDSIMKKNDKGELKKMFPCPICQDEITFVQIENKINHILTVHKKIKRFKCLICGYRGQVKGNVQSHIEMKHKKLRKFKCEICEFNFTAKSAMRKHIRHVHKSDPNGPLKKEVKVEEEDPTDIIILDGIRHTKVGDEDSRVAQIYEKDYKVMWNKHRAEFAETEFVEVQEPDGKIKKALLCPLCKDAKFQTQYHRMDHIFCVHKKIKRYRCLLCDHGGPMKTLVFDHVNRVHNKMRKFKCEICDHHFSTKASRDHHISAVHHQERKFMCDTCGRKFKTFANVQTHIKVVHLKEKNVMCTLCGKQFFDQHTLDMHMDSSHFKTKKKCPYCGEMCAKSYINTHIKHVHMDNPGVKCDICGKQLQSKNTLWRHLKSVHQNQRHFCQICGKSFTRISYLKQHREICISSSIQ